MSAMTAKIVILKDDKPIDQVLLGADPVIIGRKSDCGITIKDPAVSGNHARIINDGKSYFVEDMGSTNGVHVAGRKIEKHQLVNKDVITIGEHELKFLIQFANRSKPRARASDKAQGDSTRKEPVKSAAAGGTNASGTGYLKVLSGANAGERIELSDSLTSVGEPGIQVAAVSRRPQGHFIIHVDGGKDKNKVPLVNGEPTGFKSRKLDPGDIIEIADVEMEYCL